MSNAEETATPTPAADTYRALSHGAYERYSAADKRAGEHGYQIVQSHTDDSKKRGHTLYQHGETGHLVLAYRGTSIKRSGLKDLLTDASLALGFIPKEMREAKKTAQAIRSEFPDTPLTLSGHSLGGSKAIHVGRALGLKSVTHNAFVPPVGQFKRALKKYFKETDSQAHYHTNDIIGSTVALHAPRGHLYAYSHNTKGDPHGIRGFKGQQGVRLGKKRK